MDMLKGYLKVLRRWFSGNASSWEAIEAALGILSMARDFIKDWMAPDTTTKTPILKVATKTDHTNLKALCDDLLAAMDSPASEHKFKSAGTNAITIPWVTIITLIGEWLKKFLSS